MKKILSLVIILLILCSCDDNTIIEYNQQINNIQEQEQEQEQGDYYNSYFYKTAINSQTLSDYITKITKENKRIVNIKFNRETNVLSYQVQSDEKSIDKDFYYLSKIYDFDWTYYLYNDLFKASFHFKEVNGVSVYDIKNKKQITYLPVRSDMLYLVEGNIFYRDLYKENFDYNTLDLECTQTEDNIEDCVVKINAIKDLIKR